MDKGYFKFNSVDSSEVAFSNEIQLVYKKMKDPISQNIFTNCLLYSFTNDVNYIRSNVLLTDTGKEFDKLLQFAGNNGIYVYGAGERGQRLVETFPDKNWIGYIDQSKQGTCNNLPIITLDEFEVQNGKMIIISNISGYEQIRTDLLNKGAKEDILILEEWNITAALHQYFDSRVLDSNLVGNGFVDAGAYDGMDSVRYINWCGNENAKVWTFEPDKNQLSICSENVSKYSNVNIINAGLSDRAEKIRFVADKNGMSKISSIGTEEIVTVQLDDALNGEEVGFIKMDIEGYEENALRGAKKIIEQQHPVLAICIYHKREDIWRIPKLLLEYYPDYSFAMGHYRIGQVETVLYAF